MMRMKIAGASALPALFALMLSSSSHAAPPLYKGHPATDLLSFGGHAAWVMRHPPVLRRLAAIPGLDDGDPFLNPDAPLMGVPYVADQGNDPGSSGDGGEGGEHRNVFVNDPCLDPPPPSRRRTVQSETEIAVLNSRESRGKKIVVGYNDSYGFYNNTQGLSGVSYSIDGGKTFIDASGLPPIVKTGVACGTPGTDCYAGDPVVVVHNATETFYYSSIYLTPNGFQTLAVNRGHFEHAPPQTIESKANTRCAGNPAAQGIPDPPEEARERIIWEPPVVAVTEAELGGIGPTPDPTVSDALDKEWLYVDQRTGELYLTYTRFGSDGGTPIELVRSFDGGHTWTPPSVIVPNLADTFNQATQPIVTSTGRVIVTWHSRTFSLVDGSEISQRIEEAYSDDDGLTFSSTVTVSPVNPQGEPLGYNRRRFAILNAPYIATDRFGKNDDQGDGNEGSDEEGGAAGKVYIAYFDGTTPLPVVIPPGATSQGPGNPFARSANIKLSTSGNNGATWGKPVKVNSDDGRTTHVFPSVQVNRQHKVFVAWTDRRRDPGMNILNDVWAAASKSPVHSFGDNVRVTAVSTSWYKRADAAPNFGDYNSSELIDFERFATVWSDGRFPPGTYVPLTCTPAPPPGTACPPASAGTPDTFFSIIPGLGGGN